jgi:uncharacterized protein (DUF111 family)
MTDYNGYKNWATWNVQLWLDNDEGLYREYQRRIRRAHIDDIDGEFVEKVVRELMPNGTSDMDSAKEFKDVDWDELAEHWLNDAREYVA